MAIERSEVVAAIAQRLGVSAVAVILRWTLDRGVCVIPRTADRSKIVENIGVGALRCLPSPLPPQTCRGDSGAAATVPPVYMVHSPWLVMLA